MHLARRPGFSLIELVIACVIIGILAAMVVPNFQRHKARTVTAAMKSDLRNLVTAQESYFAAAGSYTSDVTLLNFAPSRGVAVTWGTVNAQGWSAKTAHPTAAPLECAVYVGAVSPLAPGATESVIACR